MEPRERCPARRLGECVGHLHVSASRWKNPECRHNQTLSVEFTPDDATDYSAVGATTTITVARFTPTLIVVDHGGTFSGNAFPASVTIAGTANSSTPATSLEGVSAILTYYLGSGIGGTSLGSTPPMAPGAYAVVASFTGSSDYAPTQSAAVDFTIASGPAATVALSSSSPSAVYGESLTFVAAVTRPGSVPAGMVTFFDGTTMLGNAPLDGSGEASITTASLAVGTHSITATYAASGNYLGATSSATQYRSPRTRPVSSWCPRRLQEEESGIGGTDRRGRAPGTGRWHTNRNDHLQGQEEDAGKRQSQWRHGHAHRQIDQRAQEGRHDHLHG